MPGCSILRCPWYVRYKTKMLRFPSNLSRRDIWRRFCRRDDWNPSISARLCESHFDENQFERHRQDGWRKLKPNAIPTLFPNPTEWKSKRKSAKKNPAASKKKTLKVQIKKQTSKKPDGGGSKVTGQNQKEPVGNRKRRIPLKRRYDEDEYEVAWPSKRSKPLSKLPNRTKSSRNAATSSNHIQNKSLKKMPGRTKPAEVSDAASAEEESNIQNIPLQATMILSKGYQKPEITPGQEHGYARHTKKKAYTETPPVELVEVCFSNEVADDSTNEAFSCRSCVKLTVEIAALQLENKDLQKELSCLNSAIKIFLNQGQRETLKKVAESFRLNPKNRMEF